MILNVWKPIYGKDNGVKIVKYYENIGYYDGCEIKTGWKVSYICDKCNLNKINSTTTTVLLNPKVIYNNLEFQTCRSCRSFISEYEIKKSFIPYKIVESSIISEKYQILNDSCEYDLSKNKSQFKFDIICQNNHKITTTWNNWNNGKRCRKCYEDNKLMNAVKYKDGWDLYKFIVWKYTEKTYNQYYSQINPDNVNRGREYHLDHKFSISEGFKNNIEPKTIACSGNLEMMCSKDNISKGSKCSLTIEKILELSEKIN
jgi:hypothetical protein